MQEYKSLGDDLLSILLKCHRLLLLALFDHSTPAHCVVRKRRWQEKESVEKQTFKLFSLFDSVAWCTYESTQLIPPFRLVAAVLWCWSWEKEGRAGPWHLICTLEVFHVHSYQDQFIQPGWAEFFCVFSLDLCFVCLFVLFDLFVCPHSFMFPWASGVAMNLNCEGLMVTSQTRPESLLGCGWGCWV